MAADAGLIGWVSECLEPIGKLTKRAMMGGATLYLDGIVFAIIDADALWLKADSVSNAIWDAQGCARFTFQMGEKTGSMNYRCAPDDVYDDVDAMIRWSALAVEAGMRAAAKKRPKRSKT
jgi:DNA transformation protein and related proteins